MMMSGVCLFPPDRERQRRAYYASGAVQEGADQRSQGTVVTVHSHKNNTGTYLPYAPCAAVTVEAVAVKHESVIQ